MDKQPKGQSPVEALRLADELDRVAKWSDSEHWETLNDAAAELRRLYALNQELVKTLKWLDNWMGHKPLVDCAKQVRAAIAKAKAENLRKEQT